MSSLYESIRLYENLDKIKKKDLIKKIKCKLINTSRLVELEKDFRDYLEIQKTLLYLYCNNFEVGKK